MKHLIPIVGILLLTSCHTNVGTDVQDSALTGTKEKAYEMEYAAPYMVAGRFISSDKMDTLYFRRYSEKAHRYVDSLPIWGDDYMLGDDIEWFRGNDIVMKVSTSDGRIIHIDSDAMYIHRAISLPGITPGMDLLAVVWKHQDFSGIKPCHIVSVKDGQWTELGSFTVNTNVFPDTLTDGMIDGFLEKKNGTWMFSDWTEQLQYEGDCPMRPIQQILYNELTPSCLNSVVGHNEKDTIVGNFTGSGIDTIYIVEKERDTTNDWEESVSYYAVSNNKRLPSIKLYGYPGCPPRLVFEGDLDGNGTDEWGYLHTWMNSQWRYYRVFSLVKGEWRYLVESNKLDTPEWFRCSGQEIIEPACSKGYVKIHYGTFGPDLDCYDTVEKVTFSKIND